MLTCRFERGLFDVKVEVIGSSKGDATCDAS
jgi:hypothetical protein